MSGVERVGAEAFDGERLRRPGTVVVGFLADWCPYCVRFAPQLQRLARRGASVLLADVSDEASPLWETFRIEIVPSVVVFHDGEPVARADGVAGLGLTPEQVRSIRAATSARRPP